VTPRNVLLEVFHDVLKHYALPNYINILDFIVLLVSFECKWHCLKEKLSNISLARCLMLSAKIDSLRTDFYSLQDKSVVYLYNSILEFHALLDESNANAVPFSLLASYRISGQNSLFSMSRCQRTGHCVLPLGVCTAGEANLEGGPSSTPSQLSASWVLWYGRCLYRGICKFKLTMMM
jgi:hypothetical protein